MFKCWFEFAVREGTSERTPCNSAWCDAPKGPGRLPWVVTEKVPTRVTLLVVEGRTCSQDCCRRTRPFAVIESSSRRSLLLNSPEPYPSIAHRR